MLSVATLWTLARRVPGILWVIGFAVSLAVGGWFAAVHIGEQRGEMKVQRAAVADSVVHVTAKLDTVRHRSDSLVHVATTAKVESDAGRAATRAVMEAHLADTPLEVQQAVDAQLTRDSLALEAHVAPITSLLAERPLEEKRDTLRVSQAAIGVPEPDQHRTRYVVGGAMLGAGVVITILHFLR
jgi:hypothetical protein